MSFEALRRRALAVLGMVVAALATAREPAPGAEEPSVEALERAYQGRVRPLFEEYCYRCHSGDRIEADIDLAAFRTMADVRAQPRVWQRVGEMLDSGQMPPEKAPQPTDSERSQLVVWVRHYLTIEARARAGDPGRVVLRRLSNAEYTYTVRDLTGVEALDPAREFPVDGAAGEGFTNTGDALVMSPSLIAKYLGAAKEIASHAVLLPDGLRFSPHTTQRDQTDELLARIREFYGEFTVGGGGSAVDLQGIRFDTNQGGLLPLEAYLSATLSEREALRSGKKAIAAVARERGLNARYLATLWGVLALEPTGRSPLLDGLRERWRAAAADARRLAAGIAPWQQALWKFNSIGHIGRAGGPPAWMAPVDPIVSREEFRLTLPASPDGKDVPLYLAAGDAGDGNAGDYVVWTNPRLEGAGKAALPLRDAAGLYERLVRLRRAMLGHTARYLAAAAEAMPNADVAALASARGLDGRALRAWMRYLGLARAAAVNVTGHFEQKLLKGGNYDFIRGWGTPDTPSVVANSSDQEVRIPGIARPRSLVVHPSPTLFAAVGWQSPIDGAVEVEARLSDAHPECGNGVEWVLEHRTGAGAARLWRGDFATAGAATLPPKAIDVGRGELVALIVGPRQGNHFCDLTAMDIVITETHGAGRVWDLAHDVSGDILAGNPHADSHGNGATWHFYRGEMAAVHDPENELLAVPAGSLLWRWQAAENASERRELAARVEALAVGEAPADAGSPDARLFRHLQSLALAADHGALAEGVEPDARFGRHPLGHATDAADLVVEAPHVLEFRVPTELAAGRDLVVTAHLEAQHGRDGSVQLQVSTTKPELGDISPARPIVARDGSVARSRLESAFQEFRQLFPIALCYTQIVPVDEVVTLTLFYREDEHLRRLMLEDEKIAQLDRLWDELYFVSHEPLKYLVAFEQIEEFSTQDRPDLVEAWKPHRQRTEDRAAAFRERLIDSEPTHVNAALDFADRAWRRRLTADEQQGLRDLYRGLRGSGLSHAEAIRLTLARVLTSPAFLYRVEEPARGETAAPVSGVELASRLSYFLWSSMPDAELRHVAEAGQLTDDKTLVREARRMLADDRVRRLAIEFACQWLHIRGFDLSAEKNEALYPEFAALRGSMYEEAVRFFQDLFQNDRSILSLLDADHTFLNEPLARHYGIGGVRGSAWRRVEGVRSSGRGGVLGMAAVLAQQSGASRSSPILRGNWVFETLLGERLPRPPAKVPELPDVLPGELTERQLTERHSAVPECAKCHARIDPYGFALEAYDAIGRLRRTAPDTRTQLAGGQVIDGIEGLRAYLLKDRRGDVLGQFCRKLLGYALGREVQLSDRPLLAEIERRLAAAGYRFSALVEAIVTSRQFREIRGRAASGEE